MGGADFLSWSSDGSPSGTEGSEASVSASGGGSDDTALLIDVREWRLWGIRGVRQPLCGSVNPPSNPPQTPPLNPPVMRRVSPRGPGRRRRTPAWLEEANSAPFTRAPRRRAVARDHPASDRPAPPRPVGGLTGVVATSYPEPRRGAARRTRPRSGTPQAADRQPRRAPPLTTPTATTPRVANQLCLSYNVHALRLNKGVLSPRIRGCSAITRSMLQLSAQSSPSPPSQATTWIAKFKSLRIAGSISDCFRSSSRAAPSGRVSAAWFPGLGFACRCVARKVLRSSVPTTTSFGN